jgi:hypothetical protein
MIVTERRGEGGHKTRFLYRKRYEIGLFITFCIRKKQCEALKTLRKWRGEGFYE